MSLYTNFIGIDIGKFTFVVNLYNSNNVDEFDNNSSGISQFLSEYSQYLKNSLCVLETTGGYEIDILYTLCNNKNPVHRANTRKVKNFIRSYGNAAKTDNLDAKALAKYGFERNAELDLFKPKSSIDVELYQLLSRRNDLKQMLIAEKNRLKSPGNEFIKSSCTVILSALEQQIKYLSDNIKELISSDKELKAKQDLLKSIPGIGEIVSSELLILLPELGSLDRKKIASLAGLAPISNDSGSFSGYRRIGHGRKGVKPSLFIAAMSARNSNSELKVFYEKLIVRGKRKMVALTALMRKIIVIANARLRDYMQQQNCYIN